MSAISGMSGRPRYGAASGEGCSTRSSAPLIGEQISGVSRNLLCDRRDRTAARGSERVGCYRLSPEIRSTFPVIVITNAVFPMNSNDTGRSSPETTLWN